MKRSHMAACARRKDCAVCICERVRVSLKAYEQTPERKARQMIYMKDYMKTYNQTLNGKAAQTVYNQTLGRIEQKRVYQKVWRQKPEAGDYTKTRRQTPEYKDYHRLYAQNRRNQQRTNGGSVRPADWLKMQQDAGYRCTYCTRQSLRLTQDHIVPVILGGWHIIQNITPACVACNSSKGSRLLSELGEDWITERRYDNAR